MLRKITDLRGFELSATDGEIGRVTEFYFDDLDWTVLYMVADPGAWLPGRKLLVSPASLGEIDWIARKMEILVTRSEIESSPEIDLHQPITREQEVTYFAHFGWACLWEGDLRSTQEVIGNQVIVNERERIGEIEDLIIDDLWTIRYLVLSIENLNNRKTLLSPSWIEDSDWADSKMITFLAPEKFETAPIYDATGTIKREYEEALYEHYEILPYWT